MEPIRVRRSRREDRRSRPVAVEVQALETRQLLAWSPLGFSLPDLTISGYGPPVAAYGEEIAVTIRVQNQGASSIYEPLALEPGSLSTADALPTKAAVFLSPSPRFGAGAIKIGEIDVPAIRQNSWVELTETVEMPARLPFLPGSGGTVYLYFRADADRTSLDYDRTNNTTLRGVPVQIQAPLPELVAIGIDVPTVMQPGDAIAPTIQIANYGTTNPDEQVEAFQVALVASTDPFFGPGDQVLATYEVSSLPPLSVVPMQRAVLGNVNVEQPVNILSIHATEPVILPQFPGEYYIGVIVDPANQVREISEVAGAASSELNTLRRVGPPVAGLPPAGVVEDPLENPGAVFPFTPYTESGRLPRLYEGLIDPPIIIDPFAAVLAARREEAAATGVVRLRVNLGQSTAPTTPSNQLPGRRGRIVRGA